MKFRLLHKMTMALAVLFCSVVSANAAQVTYQLTTHVDGRTITATANLASGADLEAYMPQALWRGYTDYKFYSDADLTQEISEFEDGISTVYVDYEFNPPFILSKEGEEPVWCYFRNAPGTSDEQWLYYSEYKAPEKFYSQDNLKTGSMLLKDRRNAQWAIYGDAYSLNLKFNDVNNKEANDYMQPVKYRQSFFSYYTPNIGGEKQPGWQVYDNKYAPGYFSLGLPEYEDEYLYIYDNANFLRFNTRQRYVLRDGHNNITCNEDFEKGNLEPYAFVITPASEGPDPMYFFHVTYRLMEEGKMINEIVKQKNLDAKENPNYPEQEEGYVYTYYTDAECTTPWVGYLPVEENSIVYVKRELAEEDITITRDLTKDRWITLVLPYDVKDVNQMDGLRGEALEYVSLSVGRETSYWSEATLTFQTVQTMEANKPYLFRAVEFADGGDYGTLKVYEGPESGKPVESDIIPVNHDNNLINVEMKGTYEGKTLDVAPYSEPKGYQYIYFYFGYDPQAATPYNFYVVDNGTVQINPYLCYFNVTYIGPKDEAAGAKDVRLSFSQDTTGINQVGTVAERNAGKVYNLNGQEVSGSLSKGVYIVNGKKVLVK